MSKYEEKIGKNLEERGVAYEYETVKLSYTIPAKSKTYTPDWIIGSVIVESKGLFSAKDREKMVLVRDQNPELDIRLLFQKAQLPIYPRARTNCGEWADKNGFIWADGIAIPEEWVEDGKRRPSQVPNPEVDSSKRKRR